MSDADMIRLPGGTFRMGSEAFYDDEGPIRQVHVGPFELQRTLVTNRQFAEFVDATGYLTVAERHLGPRDYPGIAPELLQPASAVFIPPDGPVDLDRVTWWHLVPGACWRAPEGPGSEWRDRPEHPVVHVAYEDALAYARWIGARLPTEAEWEYAARGGLDGCEYAWGDESRVDGVVPAVVWPGEFPVVPPGGSFGTAPVASFPPNGYGFCDLIGNVWEWTCDPYDPNPGGGCCVSHDRDPLGIGGPELVLKGGSFLCADNYCRRYRPAARIPQSVESSASNVGFRCARSISS